MMMTMMITMMMMKRVISPMERVILQLLTRVTVCCSICCFRIRTVSVAERRWSMLRQSVAVLLERRRRRVSAVRLRRLRRQRQSIRHGRPVLRQVRCQSKRPAHLHASRLLPAGGRGPLRQSGDSLVFRCVAGRLHGVLL